MRIWPLIISTLILPSRIFAGYGFSQLSEIGPKLDLAESQAAYSISFSSPQATRLKTLSLYCLKSAGRPSVAVELYVDKNGVPDKKSIAGATLVPAEGAWAVFQFNDPAIKEGQRYHLVISHDSLRGGSHPVETLGPQKFASFAAAGPEADPKFILLSGISKSWKKKPLTPIFILRGTGGVLLGNPYTLSGAVSIHGNNTPERPEDDLWQAQVLHFKCGTTAKQMKVRVRKLGRPTHPLHFEIQKHHYATHQISPLLNATAIRPEAASRDWRWISIDLPGDSPFPLSPVCHYVAFHSPAGRAAENNSCEDCWQISYAQSSPGVQGAADLSFGGGAHRSRAASSVSGSHWEDFFERDLHVVMESGVCPETSPQAPAALPTPEYYP